MPRYKVRGDINLGKSLVHADVEFAWVAWPLDSFVAVNQSAEDVKSYYAENIDNPALLPSPWCYYRRGIVLPELPEPPADPKVSVESREIGAEIQAQDRNAARARAEEHRERDRKARCWEGLTQ